MSNIYVDFVGDSITVGFPGQDGFRPGVVANLLARALAKTILYDGRFRSGSTPSDQIDGIVGAIVPTWFATYARPGWPGQITCHRIMLGTNDVRSAPLAAAYVANYNALLSEIHLNDPNSCVSVSRLPPEFGFNTEIATANGQLPGIVATAVGLGQKVILEADAGLVYPGDFQVDGIHPNASGYAKLVPVAADGIVAACTLAGFLP